MTVALLPSYYNLPLSVITWMYSAAGVWSFVLRSSMIIMVAVNDALLPRRRGTCDVVRAFVVVCRVTGY